jgi:hypothetical protein
MGKEALILMMIEMLYKSFLRDLLVSAVDDPDKEWDNVVLDVCDKLFGYTV